MPFPENNNNTRDIHRKMKHRVRKMTAVAVHPPLRQPSILPSYKPENAQSCRCNSLYIDCYYVHF